MTDLGLKMVKVELAHDLLFTDFVDTMVIGGYEEQIAKTAHCKAEDLNYFGVVLFGNYEIVYELTKKFSLLKG